MKTKLAILLVVIVAISGFVFSQSYSTFNPIVGSSSVTASLNIVNPMNFGAFADGVNHAITAQDITDHSAGGSKKLWIGTIARTVTDGVTTAGSQTITSATANFTGADVGQRIEATGIPAGSRISGVTNSTTATINVFGFEAGSSGTGVTFSIGDYIAGDQWDYVALQEAIYAAFQNSTTTPNKANRWLNKQLYIPAGRYRVNKAPAMYEVQGGVVFGDGRLTTQIASIRARYPAWECNGLWFTQFTGIQWFSSNGDKNPGFPLYVVDGNWDGKHTQGVQGNTWKDCHWDADFTFAPIFAMCLHSTNSQGSENLWLDCHFNNPATVLGSAAVLIYTYNALQNTFIGGNFTQHITGVQVNAGSANLNSVGFQALKPQQQDLEGFDVSVVNSANAHVAMTNCRSESSKSIFAGNGVVFTGDSDVVDMVPPQGTWTANHAYAQGDSIVGVTGGNGNGHMHRCLVAGTSGGTEPVWNDNDGAPCVEILDGAITSGTTSLTTSGGFNNLTSFMPGRGIMVVGAGVAGANLYTTVVSGGGNNATLTASASTTVTSARAIASPITTDGGAQWIHDEYKEAFYNTPATVRNCSFRFGQVQSTNNTWPSVFEHCNFARSDWAYLGTFGTTPQYNGFRFPVTTTLDGKIATVNQITLNGGFNDGVTAVMDATPARNVATTATTGTMTVTMDREQITITPTGNCTFNASGGTIGYRSVFYITTSGTTSFTMTWGTNYKTTGTLATGTVSGKVYTVTFTCGPGSVWTETGRTGPL